MAQLYTVGTSPAGKKLNMIQNLFTQDEIPLLEEMSNDEQLNELEESIMMNDSSIGNAYGRSNSVRNFGNKVPSMGLMDFG